jgi:hypothetical protein
LSFDQVALDTALRSLTLDLTNYSAHRFLSDAYWPLPRYGTARVSELLQAQLLEPANANSIQPQMRESNLLISDRTGPPIATYPEFTSLFNRDGIRTLASGVVGTQNTWGDEILVSALKNSGLLSAGQFHFETVDKDQKTSLNEDIFNTFVQKDISPYTSVQAEYRSTRMTRSTSRLPFDPQDIQRDFQEDNKRDIARVGFRQTLSDSSNLVVSLVHQERENTQMDHLVSVIPDFPLQLLVDAKITEQNHVNSTEAQYLYGAQQVSLVSGAGYYDDAFTKSTNVVATLSDGTFISNPFRVDDSSTRQTNLYAYLNWQTFSNLTVALGVSGDSLKQGYWYEKNYINPKAGLVWQPWAGTAVRVGTFRYVKRSLPAGATLEPTQVAGFNQLFDDPDGTDSRSWGLGLDQTWRNNLFAGAEYVNRKLTFASPPAVGTDFPSFEEHWNHNVARAYLSWLFHSRVSLSTEYRYELQELTDDVSTTGLSASKINTSLVPLTVTYHDPTGLFAYVRGTYARQTLGFFVQGDLRPEVSSFWNVDAAIGYRLPSRVGQVSLVVKNLFDEEIRFDDANPRGDPRPPQFSTNRAVFLNFSVAFQ